MSRIGLALALLAGAGVAQAGDAFDGLTCDADIAKGLIGKKISDEPVADIEKRHGGLGLRDEGGDEIGEALFYQSWTICGASYHLLERRNVISDVVEVAHSPKAPSFVGTCTVAGKEQSYPVLAILEPSAAATALRATKAWRIDEKNAKFISVPAKGMTCPRAGIDTADVGS